MCITDIVELHGGDVSVYSAGEGSGSTFTLNLPAVKKMHQSENLQNLAIESQIDSNREFTALSINEKTTFKPNRSANLYNTSTYRKYFN